MDIFLFQASQKHRVCFLEVPMASSSVHGLFQERILEWVAISFSKGTFWPRDWTLVFYNAGSLLHCRQILYWLSYWGSPERPIHVLKLLFVFLLLICLLLQGRFSQEPVSKKKIILPPPEGKEQEGQSPLMTPQVILEHAQFSINITEINHL